MGSVQKATSSDWLLTMSEVRPRELKQTSPRAVRLTRFFTSAWFWGAIAFAVSLIGSLSKMACADQFWGASIRTYRLACYSDLGPLYAVRGVGQGVIPYLQSFHGSYLEYPVLTGALIYLTHLLALGFTGYTEQLRAFVMINWLLAAGFAAITAMALRYLTGARKYGVLLFAASPLLFFDSGINWDLLAVCLAITALLAHQRQRYRLAGVLIALGAAAKLWPILLLPMFLLDLCRRDRRTEAIKVALASLAAWLAVNLPVLLANPTGWSEFYRFSRSRGLDAGSIWLALDDVRHVAPTTSTINAISTGAFFLAALGIGWAFSTYRISLHLGITALVVVFTVVGKVYSPQYALWLLPMFILTVRNRPALLAWQALQVLYFFAIWQRLLGLSTANAQGISDLPYGILILLMHLSTVLLLGLAWWGEQRKTGPTLG